MLHRETVSPDTLELLTALQANPFFENTRLVGGTALSLQLGHRISIDLDLFGDFVTDPIAVQTALQEHKNVVATYNTPSIFAFVIDGVKVDLVNYRYGWIDDPLVVEGVVMASQKDIGAMKLSAVTGRGTKKDFVDLYFLLETYTLGELIGFFEEKYPDGNTYLLLRSFIYFDDADDMSVEMIHPVSWPEVKNKIQEDYFTYIDQAGFR